MIDSANSAQKTPEMNCVLREDRGGSFQCRVDSSHALPAAHLVTCWHARIIHGHREHADQHVLQPAGVLANVEQALLEVPRVEHVHINVKAQHFAKAVQKLKHHQAVGESGRR